MVRADAPVQVGLRALVFAAGCCAAGLASAQTKELLPLWEVGGGLAYAHLPDYRGSDEAHSYVLPFPLLVYRGDFLRSDREGVRALFLDSRYVELELSAGATVPVRSTKNRTREGMPDLRPTLELGPALKVHLAHIGEQAPGERDFEFDFRLPVRRAITWRDGLRDVGTLAFPSLNVDRKIRFAGSRWNLGLVAGAYFADRRYNDYFYGVKPEFATADRPAYAARGGFSGWQSIVALSTTYGGRTWVGGFVKADWLKGATFDDSPLVRRRSNISFGFGVSHIFAKSDRQVEVSR
jgi:outer membrane scaffolding protein for murein synthesis (MipA/OmpV family)